MRIEQFQYFLEIARTGSITAAADNLFISQQSLCTSLNRLEKELGFKLFDRTKRGTTLTEDGRALGVYIADIMASYQRFEDALAERRQNIPRKLNGSLTLCVTPLLAEAMLPDMIRLIQKQHPQIHLGFRELSTPQIIDSVAASPSNLGLLLTTQTNALSVLPQLNDTLSFQVLSTDQMTACVSATSTYSLREYLTTEEFQTATRVSFSLELPGTDPAPENADDRSFSSNNIRLHQKLIKENTAIGSVPSLLFPAVFADSGIVSLPIEPPIPTDLVLVSQCGQLLPEAQAALSLIQSYLAELSSPSHA